MSAFLSMSRISYARLKDQKLPSDLPPLSWEECCNMVLARLDMLSCREVAQIIYCCSEGRYVNVELLQAIIEWGRNPLNLSTFQAPETGFTVKGLGLLMTFSQLEEGMPQSKSLNPHARHFVLALLKNCITRDVFLRTDFKGMFIAGSINGMGRLFSKDRSKESSKVFDTLMGQFMDKCVFFDSSPSAIHNVLHGCWSMAYNDKEVINSIMISTLTSLVSGKDFGDLAGGVVWGFSRLGITNSQVLRILTMQVADKAHSVGLSCLLYTLRGLVGYKESYSSEIKVIVNELLKLDRIKKMRSEALGSIMATIVNATGEEDYEVKQGLTNLAQEACQLHHFHRLKPIDLYRIFRSMHQMKIADKFILTKLGSKIFTKEHLTQLPHKTLVNVFYAAGSLGYDDVFAIEMLAAEMTKSDRLSKYSSHQLALVAQTMHSLAVHDQNMVDALSHEIIKHERLSSFSTQEIAMILNGYAAVGYENDGVINTLLREVSGSHHEIFQDGRSLAVIIRSCEKLSSLDENHLFIILCRIARQANSFSTHELCQMMGSLRLLVANDLLECTAKDVLNFFKTVLHIILMKRDTCKTRDWMSVMLACISMRYFDNDLMEILTQHCQAVSDRRFFARFLSLCSMFDYQTADISQLICDYPIADAPCDFSIIGSEIQAKAQLGKLSLDEYQQYCKKLEAIMSLEQGSVPQCWWQILQGWIVIEVLGNKKIECPLTCKLVARAKQERLLTIADRPSQFEDTIRALLVESGVNVSQDKAVLGCLQQIDIMIPGTPPTVVEVDGPRHFTINKVNGVYKETGSTLFRNKILKSLGFKVFVLGNRVSD